MRAKWSSTQAVARIRSYRVPNCHWESRYHLGNFSVAAGYDWTNWFNAVTPLEFSDSFNGGTLAAFPRDLGLHGFFINSEIMF